MFLKVYFLNEPFYSRRNMAGYNVIYFYRSILFCLIILFSISCNKDPASLGCMNNDENDWRFDTLVNLDSLYNLEAEHKGPKTDYKSDLGISMIHIPKGTFMMGNKDTLPDSLMPGDRYNDLLYLKAGDSDEQPAHQVIITCDFYISATEITVEEFQKFRPEFIPASDSAIYVEGINWYDAMAYCEWLSEKEGLNYRLPTEAEWEYVAKGAFVSKVKNMATLPAEWCFDWYGPYISQIQVNPAGPLTGLSKVIRGGGLDKNTSFFERPSNRASMGPAFPPESYAEYKSKIEPKINEYENELKKNTNPDNLKSETRYLNFIREAKNNQGNHHIGFRIVRAPYPEHFLNPLPDFPRDMVKKNEVRDQVAEPYFKKRFVLPTPPENLPSEEINYISATGLNKNLLTHNHCPSLVIMPNGDAFMAIFSSASETAHDVKIICSRLRYGADEWDMPEVLVDFADANDHAPLLWQEGDTTRLYWGNNKYDAGFPFQWIESYDYGQTWTEPRFPVFVTPVGPHSAQPITSAFRDEHNNIFVASDGVGPSSALWRSEDNGKTWIDPRGRTAGRHTAFVLLKNGSILGMGGKSSQINGFMPKSISKDKGETWEVSASPFIAQGPGQRPSILRLRSGRLVMAGDFSSRLTDELTNNRPAIFKERGCYVAWSDDEGETWTTKKLPETQFPKFENDRLKDHTLGYSVLKQGPNGNIHLLGTITHPVLHYEFSEAWLESNSELTMNEQSPVSNKNFKDHSTYNEYYEDGDMKSTYSFAYNNLGQAKLDGHEKWFYPNGKIKYEVYYYYGRKSGSEILWSDCGKKIWQWNHLDDGPSEFCTYWQNGQMKSSSFWKDKKCTGKTKNWDKDGNLILELEYEEGRIKQLLSHRN